MADALAARHRVWRMKGPGGETMETVAPTEAKAWGNLRFRLREEYGMSRYAAAEYDHRDLHETISPGKAPSDGALRWTLCFRLLKGPDYARAQYSPVRPVRSGPLTEEEVLKSLSESVGADRSLPRWAETVDISDTWKVSVFLSPESGNGELTFFEYRAIGETPARMKTETETETKGDR